ncbi:MAG: BatA domain-containing protein [Pirellulales bacterium]|nr:BatA domain-containing protein [Pirellulales bacterium]
MAFGFGNLLMLGWLGAAAIPLIVHLWNRRKYREVSWAAIEFLLAAMRRNSKRIRVEQWLLLAVRTLLIALLVLALAEPYLQRVGLRLAAGERSHRVLVIDGSYSMGYRPSDRSRFERAKELAAQIVEEGAQGDGFSLIVLGKPPRIIVGTPAFEPRAILEELEGIELQHTAADLPATFEKVEEVLVRARREHPRLVREEVYFLTDLQRSTWLPDLGAGEAATAFRGRATRLDENANLVIIDLGQPTSANLALADLRLNEPLATVGRDVTIEAEVARQGTQAGGLQLVELLVDGRRAGEAQLDLNAPDKAVATFNYRFDSGGEHAIEVRIAGDPLDVDNHRWLALSVKQELRVLCVNGKPAGGAFQGATDYLVRALSPNDDPERAFVRPEVVPESALVERDLSHYDCIFLANVGQFTPSEAQVLDHYLRQGGGLVFFLGDQVQADSYNRQLSGEGEQSVRVLPALLGPIADEGNYQIDPLDYRHPLVSVFRGQERSGLLTTPVKRYFKLSMPEQSRAKVALGLVDGDPLIVEEPIHRGRSILVATSADISWTPMPMWASYVPIVQELVSAAVGGQLGQRNVLVGASLGGGGASWSGDATVSLVPPANSDTELPPIRVPVSPGDGVWSYSDTYRSGIYEARFAAPAATRQLFAVNVDPAESDLTQLEAEELRSGVWEGVDLIHQTTWKDLDERPQGEISQRSRLHRWLLYGVLGLLLTETYLARRFGHHHV